jgi:hypothetical protein
MEHTTMLVNASTTFEALNQPEAQEDFGIPDDNPSMMTAPKSKQEDRLVQGDVGITEDNLPPKTATVLDQRNVMDEDILLLPPGSLPVDSLLPLLLQRRHSGPSPPSPSSIHERRPSIANSQQTIEDPTDGQASPNGAQTPSDDSAEAEIFIGTPTNQDYLRGASLDLNMPFTRADLPEDGGSDIISQTFAGDGKPAQSATLFLRRIPLGNPQHRGRYTLRPFVPRGDTA